MDDKQREAKPRCTNIRGTHQDIVMEQG